MVLLRAWLVPNFLEVPSLPFILGDREEAVRRQTEAEPATSPPIEQTVGSVSSHCDRTARPEYSMGGQAALRTSDTELDDVATASCRPAVDTAGGSHRSTAAGGSMAPQQPLAAAAARPRDRATKRYYARRHSLGQGSRLSILLSQRERGRSICCAPPFCQLYTFDIILIIIIIIDFLDMNFENRTT